MVSRFSRSKVFKVFMITAFACVPSMSYGMMQRLGLQRMARSSKTMFGRMQQNISAATARGFAAKQLPARAAMKTAALLGGAGLVGYEVASRVAEMSSLANVLLSDKALREMVIGELGQFPWSAEPIDENKLQRVVKLYPRLFEKNILLRGVFKKPHERNATEAHAAAYPVLILSGHSTQAFATKPVLKAMVEDIEGIRAMTEREDRETFVSGQHWSYQLATRLHTDLHALCNGRIKRDDHIIMHVPSRPKWSVLVDGQRKRVPVGGLSSKLKENGNKFFNYGTAENALAPGSHSLNYIHNNGDAGSNDGGQVSMDEIFESNGLLHLYKKYEVELAELSKMHAGLTRYGNMSVASIKTSSLGDILRARVDVAVFKPVDACFLANHRAQPKEDNIAFVMAMQGKALDPDFEGLSVREVNETTVSDDPALKAKLHVFNATYDELMGKIKKDIKRERDLQQRA